MGRLFAFCGKMFKTRRNKVIISLLLLAVASTIFLKICKGPKDEVVILHLPSALKNLFLQEFALSPDFSKVAITCEKLAQNGKEWHLFVLAINGMKILADVKLPPMEIPFAMDPAKVIEWSPDNTKLLVRAYLGKEGKFHKYGILLIDIKQGSYELLNNTHPGCITQSWNEDSTALLLTEYSEKNKIATFEIFYLGKGKKELFRKENVSICPPISGLWDLQTNAVYFVENGQGIYRIAPPYDNLEKISGLPLLSTQDAPIFMLFNPSSERIAFVSFVREENKWQVGIFDAKKNKTTHSMLTKLPLNHLSFRQMGKGLWFLMAWIRLHLYGTWKAIKRFPSPDN